MKCFSLPWPVEELRKLGSQEVRMRVTLSTFIEPNPSETARGTKYGYASHNLRFKVSRADEGKEEFWARISAVEDAERVDGEDNWTFGSNRRDVGSIQIDEFVAPASDLARQNHILVHPVQGWWKLKNVTDPENRHARFALIVEIDAGDIKVDLYTAVKSQIDLLSSVVV